MSVFDCHVNRSPVGGRIERMVYHSGAFLSADLDKASEDERAQLLRHCDRDRRALSASSRSPASWRAASCRSCGRVRRSAPGERIGMIRFGSRVDVYLPDGAQPLVHEGQTAIAGETVLAEFKAAEPGRAFRAS